MAYTSLLDLEIPVSISFGSAKMPLRDVIKLTAGSVVELNRALHDPAEISVNDVVIAVGEVVAVDGHYGVRIKEVFSRELLAAQVAGKPESKEE